MLPRTPLEHMNAQLYLVGINSCKNRQSPPPLVCQFPDPPLIMPIENNGSYKKSLEVSVLGFFIGPIVVR